MASAEERLVGREDELASLERMIAGRDLRRARFVAVSGEPGIGKTRLLGDVCAMAADRGCLVLEGRATEFEREVPFALLLDALDDYLGSLHPHRLEPLGPERLAELACVFPALSEFGSGRALDVERYRLHRAVRALLELLGDRTPLLLALDDVHWLDSASLEVLSHLLRHPPRVPALTALAFRPAQLPSRLSAELAAAAREGGAESVALHALTLAQTGELLGGAWEPEHLQTVFEQSGGNPFFAQQLARMPSSETALTEAPPVGEGVPQPVAAAIDRELQTLTGPARLLLMGAAVAGDPFDLELAAAASAVERSDARRLVDELLRMDLVRPADVPTRFRLRHPIVRRAVYESSGRGWRLGAHERLAAALLARGAPAAEVVHHVELTARPGDRDAVALLAAAGHGVAGSAPAIAARRFRAALGLLPGDATGSRLELLVPLATSLAAAGDLEAARDAAVEAQALLGGRPAAERIRLVSLCAAIEHLLGRHQQAHARLRRALEELPEDRFAEAVLLELELSADALYAADWHGMARWATRALASAGAARSPPLTLAALARLCFASASMGRIRDAERQRSSAMAVLEVLDDAPLGERLDAILYLGWAEYWLQRYDDAARHLSRGIEVARATGQGQLIVQLELGLVFCLTLLGRTAAASAMSEEAVGSSRLAGNRQAVAWALIAHCLLTASVGDLEEALRTGEECVTIADGLDANVLSIAGHAQLASVCADAGHYERCIREMELAGAPGFAQVAVERRPRWCEALVQACLGLGRVAEADGWAARAEDFADGLDLPVAMGFAQRARARVLQAQDEPAQAAKLALAAAEAQERRAARIEAARSRVLAGRTLGLAGERERAVAELERARAELDACGAHRWRDEAARELRRLGRRVPAGRRRGDAAGAATLSGREIQVADLVAEGKTNSEVAAALFVSEKTVEKHLARVFEKLSISRRGAIGAKLAEQRRRPGA